MFPYDFPLPFRVFDHGSLRSQRVASKIIVANVELISALAAGDWTSMPFIADFDRTLGLEKLGCNSDVLGEPDFMRFDDRVMV